MRVTLAITRGPVSERDAPEVLVLGLLALSAVKVSYVIQLVARLTSPNKCTETILSAERQPTYLCSGSGASEGTLPSITGSNRVLRKYGVITILLKFYSVNTQCSQSGGNKH